MRFKNPSLREEYRQLHPAVQIMATYLEQFCIRNFGKDIVITRILEKIPGTSDTHPEGRAFDVRDEHNGTFYFTVHEREQIIEEMNNRFPGDDDYATCVWHSSNGGPKHLHLQVTRGDLVLRNLKNAEVQAVV